MFRSPFGRWNREQPHSLEVVNDGKACWGQCSCAWQGPLRTANAEADADCEGHEREVFDRRQAGQRLVRGRIE